MRDFELKTEFITLGQLAKACDFIDSGADAKAFMARGGIVVNGESDNRRGRKLYKGDHVIFKGGRSVRLI